MIPKGQSRELVVPMRLGINISKTTGDAILQQSLTYRGVTACESIKVKSFYKTIVTVPRGRYTAVILFSCDS